MSVDSKIVEGVDFMQKYAGTASYTLGASTAFTGGISNQVTVGPSMSAAFGGQTAFTYPMNATFAKGTYLAAINGNNVLWTNGASLNLVYGESVTYSEDNSQQAQNSLEFKAGLAATDVAKNAAIEGFVKSAEAAVKALMILNAAVTAIGAGADIAQKATESDDKNFARNATLMGTTLLAATVAGVTSGGVSRRLSSLISKLSDAYKTLTHVSTLTLSQSACTLQRRFGTTSKLDLADAGITLSRELSAAALASKLEMNAQQITLSQQLAALSTKMELSTSAAKISASSGPSLSVEQAAINAKAGPYTTLSMTPTELSLDTANGQVAFSPTSVLMQTLQGTGGMVYLGAYASSLSRGKQKIMLTDARITVTSPIIQLG